MIVRKGSAHTYKRTLVHFHSDCHFVLIPFLVGSSYVYMSTPSLKQKQMTLNIVLFITLPDECFPPILTVKKKTHKRIRANQFLQVRALWGCFWEPRNCQAPSPRPQRRPDACLTSEERNLLPGNSLHPHSSWHMEPPPPDLLRFRGGPPFGVSGPRWKEKSCLGPHSKYIVTCKHKKIL